MVPKNENPFLCHFKNIISSLEFRKRFFECAGHSFPCNYKKRRYELSTLKMAYKNNL